MLNNQAKSAQALLPIWVYLNPFRRVLTQANLLINSGSDTRKLMHLQALWPCKAYKHQTYVLWVLAAFSLPFLMGSVVQHSHSKVNVIVFILQLRSNFHAVLAKISVKKQVNSPYFLPVTSSNLSIFKKKTCILHHLAFLFWLPTHHFSGPNTRFLPPKCHILRVILPILAVFLVVLKGYVYTIAAYFYVCRFVFCSILLCVSHQNALHLASKRSAFCGILPGIQHQNALRFAAYCTVFCCKQPKNWCKQRCF